MRATRVGGPIVLIVLGLILALAVADRISGVDLSLIGWILAAGGVGWPLIELIANRPRTAVTQQTTDVRVGDPAHDARVEREVRRDDV